jgi:putative two-component system response regulator
MGAPRLIRLSDAGKAAKTEEIPDWAIAVAQSLLKAVKERDPYTYGHCKRVARDAKLLALAAGLSDHEAQVVEYSSLFHDLGKIAIPDSILLKPGPLTPKEDALMRLHPQRSVEIIDPLKIIQVFNRTIPSILHHHERVDGAGYPHGLEADQIPLGARIMAIVDTFDAMTTHRPYRKGLPKEVGYRELQLFSNRQFDAQLVKVFLQAHPKWGEVETEISEEFLAPLYRKVA